VKIKDVNKINKIRKNKEIKNNSLIIKSIRKVLYGGLIIKKESKK